MFWTYLIYFALFGLGTAYASLAVINPMICVNFALPATRKLADKGWFLNAAFVRKKYRFSVLIWAIINTVVTVVFFCFVPVKFWIAFIIGNLWTFLFGALKTGKNDNNISEYLASALPYTRAETEEDIAQVIAIIKGA